MSAKRFGLASLLINIKGPTPEFQYKLFSFVVNGELYFTGQFSGLPRGLTGNYRVTKVASRVQ